VDTPIPHVFVNLLYLSSGQKMTQFMTPVITPFSADWIPQLLKDPFNPLGKVPVVGSVWKEYIKLRYA